MASVFTQILQGDLPCYRVYEDPWIFGILARDAVQLGHTLLIPKREIDAFLDLPEPWYGALHRAARPVGRAIQAVTGCVRVGAVFAGWDVPHVHYHLLPMFTPEDLDHHRGFVREPEEQERVAGELRAWLEAQGDQAWR